MEEQIENIIGEIESIVSDLDYGDITRNKATDRLDGCVSDLHSLIADLKSDDD